MTTAEMVQQNVSAVLTTFNQAYAKSDETARANLDKIKPMVNTWKQAAYDALNSGETPFGSWEQWAKTGQNTYLYQIKTIGSLGSVPTLYKLANAVVALPETAKQTAEDVKEGAIDFAQGAGEVATAGAMAVAKPALIVAGVGGLFLVLWLALKKSL